MSEVSQTSAPTSVDLRPSKNLAYDLPASVVVFLIALPLCLGIAFASGAPIFAGLVTGIVGGFVVAPISKSPLAVSGPAAGLTVIVLDGIHDLGSYETFLLAVVIAGGIQLVLGFIRAGVAAYFIPNAVVHGMLAGIGMTLILKQLPHAIGWDHDYEGDLAFFQADGDNSFTAIAHALGAVHWGATIITLLGVIILLFWPKIPNERVKRFPAALLVVLVGIGLNLAFSGVGQGLTMRPELLVAIPDVLGGEFSLSHPNFSWEAISNPAVWQLAAVLAAVASIETLLCIDAMDKQDPFGRETPMSHELKAQGVGNAVAGLLGGIPLTAVIVRGSANVQAGGRTWVSAFAHAILLVLAVLVLRGVMNLIPHAALAAVLLHVGYKLTSPERMREVIRQGYTQWLPFFATALGIVFVDLLKGVLFGLTIGMFYVLRTHATASYFVHDVQEEEGEGETKTVRLELSENVSFLNKAALAKYLQSLAPYTALTIDARRCLHIDVDAREVIRDFLRTAPTRGISVEVLGLPGPNRDETRRDSVFAPAILTSEDRGDITLDGTSDDTPP